MLKSLTSRRRKPRSPPTPLRVDQDSVSAWASLCEIGGIELSDRDADLEEAMRVALARDAPSFQAALAAATTDELIRALFAAVAPFAAMFQDIVAYFKRAGANEGANHWNVAIGRELPEMKEFEKFLEIWGSTFAEVSAPAIGWAAKSALRHAVTAVIDDYRYDEPTSIAEVDHWYELYRQ